jgi:hypothetical protein
MAVLLRQIAQLQYNLYILAGRGQVPEDYTGGCYCHDAYDAGGKYRTGTTYNSPVNS